MIETHIAEDVALAVNGDLKAFDRLLKLGPLAVDRAATSLPEMTLTRAGLLNVLLAFQNGAAAAETVQQWASFMRWGLVGPFSGPAHTVNIAYDESHENDISDVVGRLDELGDLIDGTISRKELKAMIYRMKQ